jgi:hypothetical protein
MLFRKTAIIFAVAAFSIVTVAVPSADGITKRVRFARGKNSIILSNAVIRGELDAYIVGARAGQQMTVRVTALERNAAFSIENPGGSYLEGAGEMDDATSVSRRLPETGDYRIVVGGTRGNATYKLTITIK